MAKKKSYYVGVIDEYGKIGFVTSINWKTKVVKWNEENKTPIQFTTQSTALDIILGLTMNFIPAVLITSLYSLDDVNIVHEIKE